MITVAGILFSWSATAQECLTCKTPAAGQIFCDDFESEQNLSERYFGYDDDDGEFIIKNGVGRNGSRGMRVKWQKGEVEAGVLQKAIGRSPDWGMHHSEFLDSNFNEIYWRIDVRTEPGWEGGGGDKLTRATTIATKNWQQGMIAHLWSGGSDSTRDFLVMDPASGINDEGKLVSNRYNDFDHLRWMGNRKGNIDLFSTRRSGEWFCVVGHIKLNTPGRSDGVFEYWINDSIQNSRRDLNWHSTWNSGSGTYGINAVFFENYWNRGAVKDEERYFDNILITKTPIRCKCN